MGSMSRDDQGRLIYMEKGSPSNSSFELDKNKEVAPQEQQNLLFEQSVNMSANEGETFHAYWERFMTLLDSQSDHGHDIGSFLGYFYWGMTARMKNLANSFSGGSLFNKNRKEAMDLLASMAIMT